MSVEKELIEMCPTLRPSWKEFMNFSEFVEKAEKKYGRSHGMIKVIPPENYIGTRKMSENEINEVVLKGPIE